MVCFKRFTVCYKCVMGCFEYCDWSKADYRLQILTIEIVNTRYADTERTWRIKHTWRIEHTWRIKFTQQTYNNKIGEPSVLSPDNDWKSQIFKFTYTPRPQYTNGLCIVWWFNNCFVTQGSPPLTLNKTKVNSNWVWGRYLSKEQMSFKSTECGTRYFASFNVEL